MNIYAVAIDGPSGVGKSTIAKAIAKELSILYVDTGAMYRAIALLIQKKFGSFYNEKELLQALEEFPVSFQEGKISLGDKVVEKEIRKEEISAMSSKISMDPVIRNYLLEKQRAFAEKTSVVMEGRDITTVVLPHAKYKFFLTADPAVRAKRRMDQLRSRGEEVSFYQVKEDIEKRDFQDQNREIAPLKVAEDAIIIDSGNLTEQETIETFLSYIKEPR